jgi:hypothetical protein
MQGLADKKQGMRAGGLENKKNEEQGTGNGSWRTGEREQGMVK